MAGPLLHFAVVWPRDYYEQLRTLIPQAKKRVVVSAMRVEAGAKSGEILRLAAAAAARGVRVLVVADEYGRHSVNRLKHVPRQQFKRMVAQTVKDFAEINAKGGDATWVNPIGFNPYAGRYHAKMTIVDDDVFTFGGVNLTDDSFTNLDYMLHAHSSTLATTLAQLVAKNKDGQPTEDASMPLDAHNALLFDAGIRGRSIIYEQACMLAKKAAKIEYISQMCPTGKLGKAIKHTKNTCYFNRPWQTGWRPPTLAQLWDNARVGLQNHYQGATYLHAKCIFFENADGTKAVLSGSHNFSMRGVAFGTKEIALYSTDPQLWRAMHDIVYKVAVDHAPWSS